jgi:D-alanine-D-alanine ligase
VLDRVVARLGLPIVVKPTAGGSALGVTVVRDAHELPAALVHCFGYGHTALLEKFVAGTELAITVLDTERGPQALPAVEIAVHEGGEYDYAARYTAGSTTFYAPARVADEVAAATAAAAVRAHEALGLADLSRMDCIVDDAGVVHFLEVNTSPGLTETSLVPLALGAADLELGVVVRDLLQQAVNRTRR